MSNAAFGIAYQRFSADIRFVITASLAEARVQYHSIFEAFAEVIKSIKTDDTSYIFDNGMFSLI